MVGFRRSPLGWRRALSGVAIVIAAVATGRGEVGAQIAGTKLTTVLADVASQVAQDDPSTPPSALPAAAPLALTSLPASVQDAVRSQMMRLDAAGNVQVYVLMTEVSVTTLQALAAAGVTVQVPDAPHLRVQASVPLRRLSATASLPFVTFVRLPDYARRHTGSVVTEGDAIIHSDAARQQFGLDGTGVKVGVISDGLKGVFATGCTSNCAGVANGPIATGDLPASTGTRAIGGVLTASSGGITGQSFQSNGDLEGLPTPPCGFAGAGAEGTALLEIVHDVAPGAQLSFANADTDVAFNSAVNFLAASNDVVVDDLGFFSLPFDGTSDVSSNTAAALNNTSNRIRAYVTAVGNDADEHYIGGYVDSGVDGTTIPGVTATGHLHLFQSASDTTDVLGRGPLPYNLISLPTNGTVVIFLSWNDPAGKSTNNYDLFLVRDSSNTLVARSIDRQTGSIDPAEEIEFTNTGAAGLFRVAVQNVGNQAQVRNLNIISFEPECATDGPLLLAAGHHDRMNYNTATRSVGAESDAGGSPVSVISVGAICSASAAAAGEFIGSAAPDESCNDLSHSTAEFFSSRGPTLDGRIKPDIASIDGVSITAAGSFEVPFFGTSAAGPHVAAEAALVLQSASCLSTSGAGALDPVTARTSLRNLLISGADPKSTAPPDNVFGAGLSNALTSVQKTLPVLSGGSAVVVNGNSPNGARLTASQIGFSDPDGCPLTRVSWTGGCGASPDSALSCPFGTTAVTVSASNSGIAFSPASTLQITVTGFDVGAAPSAATVTAGQSAQYQVSVAADSGPFTGSVTLSCSGLPQGASCAFNPAVVTPGSTSVGSLLTITTTARSEAGTRWPVGPTAGGIAAIAVMIAIARRGVRPRVIRAHVWAHRPGRVVLAGAAVTALIAAHVACGSSGSGPGNSTAGTLALSPTSLTFASQAIGSSGTPEGVTLTNTGGAAVSINAIAASGDFAATNTCGSSLAPSGACTIAVTFAPTSAGQRTGTLSVSDTAANSPQTVALTGTGVSANGPTPAGTYAVSVSGASGTLVKSGTVSLVVH